MAKVIGDFFRNDMLNRIANGLPIDHVSEYPIIHKFMVITLTKAGVPFKVHNMGAGVKRITTDTDTCPCCKRKLEK